MLPLESIFRSNATLIRLLVVLTGAAYVIPMVQSVGCGYSDAPTDGDCGVCNPYSAVRFVEDPFELLLAGLWLIYTAAWRVSVGGAFTGPV